MAEFRESVHEGSEGECDVDQEEEDDVDYDRVPGLGEPLAINHRHAQVQDEVAGGEEADEVDD